MIRNLFDRFVKKSGLARPQQWLRDALGVESTHAGVEVNANTALTSSTVAACVRLLAESVASLPLHTYRRSAEGKERAVDHPLYGLLHDKPNPYQTRYLWLSQAMSHVLLHGNAFSIIERADNGRIVALWPVDPSCVTVKRGDTGITYELWTGGERRTFYYGEVLHFRGPSLDGVTGMSIIRMAKQAIGLDLALQTHGASLFKNGARPGVVLKHPETLNDEAAERLRDSFAERFAGALNSGKAFLLEGGITAEVLSFSNDDAQFLQSRQFSVQDIARYFRVPPHMVADPSRLAYASSEAEMLAFLVHSLRPWLVNLESEINSMLFPERTAFFAEFDANAIARGDQATRYAAYEKGLNGPKPWLTVAEVRAWENLPFIPGTDQLTGGQNAAQAGN